MLYSRWHPETGGFEYFEGGPEYNINDDLPTPQLEVVGGVGVPSIEAGRPLPRGAVYTGEGDQAVGLIAPADESKLVRRTSLGTPSGAWLSTLPWGGILVASAVGYGIWYLLGRPTYE